ncbi:GRAK protein, partial [Erpornis zantholeuca]|nr:GRAK protein [Erpornis zantholeuca]
ALLLPLIAVTLLTKCGCTDIIGGREVCPHSWPYMAAIQWKNSIVNCGGALVKKQWVLTAAHCRINKLKHRVVLGAHRVSVAENEQQIFKIAEIFRHDDFNQPPFENDIMLLKVLLKTLQNGEKKHGEMSLPTLSSDAKVGQGCENLNLQGGAPSHGRGVGTRSLRESCAKKYASEAKITNNMLCALGKKRSSLSDTCKGDSGGPLICADKYRGIVSFGKECGQTDIPGVYTRLTKKYIDWIKEKI